MARIRPGGFRSTSSRIRPATVSAIVLAGNFRSYAKSPYGAYTGMWGLYLPQNNVLQADSSMRISPGTFPVGTVFAWNVTPDPDWPGVNGFLHLAWGNYDDSPGTITPRQVYTITDLRLTVGWTFTGDESTGLLSECWLAAAAAPAGPFTKTHEVAFFPKVSAAAAAFVAGLPAVGAGTFTDAGGVVWNVRRGVSGTGEPYLIAYRPGYADFEGALPFRDLFVFLIGAGAITGNEWVNGLAFGPEPHSGQGTLTVDQFAPTYAGVARVPWTIGNLTATVQSATAVALAWTPAPGATSHQYRVNGGTWTNTSAPGAHTVTGLTAGTAYTFEVRGVNATGNGAQSNTAGATTTSAGAANVITNGGFADDAGWSGFWYSGKAVTAGKAVFTAAPAYDGITQPIAVTAGKYYELTWTVSGYASGSIYPRFIGGTTRNGTGRAANGTYKERLLANTGNTTFELLMDVGGTVSVDNVSLVGPYDTATVGGA